MLYYKIRNIYPELTEQDFLTTVILQDDGQGPYIKAWNHPTLPEPTQAQLDAADGAPPRQVYSCSAWQIRKALNNRSLRTQVEEAVANSFDQDIKDGWEYAQTFESNNSFVITMGAALGLNQDGVDELIQYAASL